MYNKTKTTTIDLRRKWNYDDLISWLFLLRGGKITLKFLGSLTNTPLVVGIHPAQFKKRLDPAYCPMAAYKVRYKTYLRYDFLGLTTIQLPAMEIKLNMLKTDLLAAHFVYIPGNCEHIEQYKERASFDIEEGKKRGLWITAHLINPRGVDGKGWSFKGHKDRAHFAELIVNDYVAIMKHSIDTTVGKENAYQFVVIGESLGGAYGNLVAAKLHTLGYYVMLVNIKSLDEIASFAVPMFYCQPHLFKPVARAIIRPTGWSLEPQLWVFP